MGEPLVAEAIAQAAGPAARNGHGLVLTARLLPPLPSRELFDAPTAN
jgi:hypothetical protein